MRGRAVIDGVAALILTAVLLAVPISGAISWPGWLLVVTTAAALGVLVAAVARPPTGRRGLLALVLLVVPMLALAAVGVGYGLSYVLAHLLGLGAGRLRFPVNAVGDR